MPLHYGWSSYQYCTDPLIDSQELCAQFVFCCGLVQVSFTHILQGYFTGTGNASETTLNDMGKKKSIENDDIWSYNHDKTQQNLHTGT